MKCYKGKVIKVINGVDGFFIGTTNEHGTPFCRLSQYYSSKKKAKSDLVNKSYKENDSLAIKKCCGNYNPKTKGV